MFDFNAAVGATGLLVAASWTCAQSDVSSVVDPFPDQHIFDSPTCEGNQSSALVGDMLDGVIYNLSVIGNVNDGRIFTANGDVLCTLSPAVSPAIVIDGVVQFDYNAWVRKFPEFAQLDPDQAQEYWTEAGLLFRNDATSPEPDATTRREILDLLTAHLAALFALPPIGRGGVFATVGVVTNKSVNGVSVGNSGLLPGFTGTRAWYATTQYGMKYLALTAAYRTMHYVQGPQRYPYPPNRVWPANYGVPYPWGPWQYP